MREIITAFSFLALLAMPISLRAEGARTALDRDLEGYVMASCLSQIDDAPLKEQGNAWAGAIAQRSHGDFDKFLPLAEAVKAELAATGIGLARGDGPVGSELPVPVLTCAEMQDRPAVRHALAAARLKLRKDYGAAK